MCIISVKKSQIILRRNYVPVTNLYWNQLFMYSVVSFSSHQASPEYILFCFIFALFQWLSSFSSIHSLNILQVICTRHCILFEFEALYYLLFIFFQEMLS